MSGGQGGYIFFVSYEGSYFDFGAHCFVFSALRLESVVAGSFERKIGIQVGKPSGSSRPQQQATGDESRDSAPESGAGRPCVAYVRDCQSNEVKNFQMEATFTEVYDINFKPAALALGGDQKGLWSWSLAEENSTHRSLGLHLGFGKVR